MNRRRFVRDVSGTLGVIGLTGIGTGSFARRPLLTIREVIDLFIREVPGSPFPGTVDTIKSGNADQPVTGVVTTMFATIDVIREAIKLGANLIIAHEPTFYNHLDDTTSLRGNDVYKFKQDLLDKHGIVVWRCHDYIHVHKPDGVYEGVLGKLGWSRYASAGNPARLNIPPTSLQSVIDHTKKNLGISKVRFMGNPTALCKSVTLMVGASGGPNQIRTINEHKPDLVIIGELVEWETMEYMRDLRATGANTSLIILGHIPSEEAGMQWLASWLQPRLPGIRVKLVPSGSPVKWA